MGSYYYLGGANISSVVKNSRTKTAKRQKCAQDKGGQFFLVSSRCGDNKSGLYLSRSDCR